MSTFARAASLGVGSFAAYRKMTDPLDIFFDLDHTILCSISPLPISDNGVDNGVGRTLRWFDQIDDDFPFEGNSPNTRTFLRPLSTATIYFCSVIGRVHVYTAAQKSYTDNILKVIDPRRTLFGKVLHRDDHPDIVRNGKDLLFAGGGEVGLRRSVLFDDKFSNFVPQQYRNGVLIRPFTPDRVAACGQYNMSYVQETMEMFKICSIALFCSVIPSGDARDVIKRL